MNDIKDKLGTIDSTLVRMDVTLAKQSVQLAEHMKRTEMLEERVAPIERHVIQVGAILKLLTFIAVVAETYRAIKGG